MSDVPRAEGIAAPIPHFDALFLQTPGPCLVLDTSFVIRAVNDAYCRATMTQREQIVGHGVFDIFPDNPNDPNADGVANLRASLERVLQFCRADPMAIQKYDIRKPDADGGGFEERYWSPINSPLLGLSGQVQGILHCVEDVTELVAMRASETAHAEFAREQQLAIDRLREANRELAEQMEQIKALRRYTYFFALLVESSIDPIITFLMSGQVKSWNKAAQDMFGHGASEMIDGPIARLLPPDLCDEQEALLTRLRAGEKIQNFETRRRCKDGTDITVSLTVSPIRNEHGEIIGASKIVRDITEQKRTEKKIMGLQEELIHLSRWNTMGMLASTIAHELSQPLTAALNYIRASRRTLDSQVSPEIVRVRDFLDKAANEATLAGGIMRTLREFIDKRKTNRLPQDLNKIVEEAVVLGAAGDADVKAMLCVKLATGLPSVLVDKIQIQQVLLNLIRNAIDAMRDSSRRELVIATEPDASGFVVVRVSDTGPGISPDVLAKLFQPFVTTKENGMGVGLTICQSIVESHGGRIWSEPNLAKGTSFYFRLPTTDAVGQQNAA